MNVKIEVHNNKFERKLNALNSWKVPETTKKEVENFIEKARIGQVNQGKKLSDRTLSKYLTLLKTNLEIINKQTSKLKKEDIEKYDKILSEKDFKSVADYRRNLLIFLNWKLGKNKTNKIAGWLDIRQKNKTPDYLNEQEINKLFKNCKNLSERYLICVLFDTGARIEEFLNIRYEDIEFPDKNQNFVKITLKEEYSKTKGRVISCYWKNSLNAIKDFIEEKKEEGIKSNEAVYNKSYDSVRMFLHRLGKKILNKEIHPHLFRHSSCTHYATRLNRQELCYRYGWSFSSNMPDVYISRAGMNNKELDEKFKSTELEELEKRFEKEKFNRDLEIENLKKQIENLKPDAEQMRKEKEQWELMIKETLEKSKNDFLRKLKKKK
jgi:site-specific recombinase XerD